MILDPYDRNKLFQAGVDKVTKFCLDNKLPPCKFVVQSKSEYPYDPCAYYRKDTITVCLTKCAYSATESQVRNWNWPGSTVDREPYGVLCHELGHHVDYHCGKVRGKYWSDFSTSVRFLTLEKEISSYCPNNAEWFAEMFRVFVTNPDLLRLLRPKTYEILANKFAVKNMQPWEEVLGPKCPKRIIKSLHNKMR